MRRRGQGGITLIELLVALAISGIVLVGIVSSFATGIMFERQTRESQARTDARVQFEQRLTNLLRGAYVSSTATDALTYFNGEASGASTLTGAADTVTFTTMSEGFNGSALTSDDDFETLTQSLGPQGGVSEVSLSTTAVGDNGRNKTGLFLREQRPADGDPTQGGTESIFDADVQSVQYEFYNGSDWETTWSTSGQRAQQGEAQTNAGQDGRRIPAAVRVTYTLTSDSNQTQHVFIVRLPHSDVTTANPVVPTGAAQ